MDASQAKPRQSFPWLLGLILALGAVILMSPYQSAGLRLVMLSGAVVTGAVILIAKPSLISGVFLVLYLLLNSAGKAYDMAGPSGLIYIVFGSLAAAALGNVYQATWNRKPLNDMPLAVLVLLLCHFAATEIWNPVSQPVDVVLKELLIPVLAVLIVATYRSREEAVEGSWALVIGTVAGSVILLYFIATLAPTIANYRGVQAGQNHIAGAVGFGLVICLWHVLTKFPTQSLMSWIKWGTAVVGVLAGGYALAILASRGITIAIGAALLVTMAIYLTRRQLLIAIPVMAGAFALLTALGVFSALASRFGQGDLSNLNSRLPLWLSVLGRMEVSDPFRILFGHGRNSHEPIVNLVHPALTSTHSTYVTLAYDYGIIGLLGFIALVMVILKSALKSSGVPRDVRALIAGVMTFLLIQATTTESLKMYVFWLGLGWLIAVAQPVMNLSAEAPSSSEEGESPSSGSPPAWTPHSPKAPG